MSNHRFESQAPTLDAAENQICRKILLRFWGWRDIDFQKFRLAQTLINFHQFFESEFWWDTKNNLLVETNSSHPSPF